MNQLESLHQRLTMKALGPRAIREAYQRLFDSPDGQIVLRHLMRKGFIFSSTFVAGDPHQTALNEGSRRIVLGIIRFTRMEFGALLDEYERTTEQSANIVAGAIARGPA